MVEPPNKRARRPDSKQMWDEADKRAPLPSRERDEPPRDRDREPRRDDRDGRDDRDRNRRYRSRSPRDFRSGRDRERERDRGGRRDERDYRGNGRGRDDRDRRDRDRDGRGNRDRVRERSRSRDRDARSRSPKKEPQRDTRRGEEYRERPMSLKPEEQPSKSRTATPPVSFKVGHPSNTTHDHDRMELDNHETSKKPANNIKVKKEKEKVVEEEDDVDIVVEDDGLADMQAMMGFGGFGTTHQKKVQGNDIGAVRKEKKTEYRQYMNRVGGFNRPLSPTRDG